jgi:transcriptional regulator with XRE-family HTH domain
MRAVWRSPLRKRVTAIADTSARCAKSVRKYPLAAMSSSISTTSYVTAIDGIAKRLRAPNDEINSYLYPALTLSRRRSVGCARVVATKELGPYAAFGQWLREQRQAAKLRSQPQAALVAKRKGLRLINQGKLTHIERGKNTNPSPAFLSELAQLYGLSYLTVVERWVAARYSMMTVTTTSSPAAPSVQLHAAPPAEREVDDENRPVSDAAAITAAVRELHATIGEARELANQLRRATSAAAVQKTRRQTAGARAAPTRKRQDPRKRGG